MKTINQIFIIIFIAASLILVKDDVIKVYHQGVNYLSDKISIILNKEEQPLIIDDNQIIEIKEATELSQTVKTPGALKIPDNLVSSISNSKLSAQNVINLTNKSRAEKNGNLNLLKENSKLNFSAEKKLQDMLNKQYFEHVSPTGVGVSDLANQVSYEYITVGENLAMGNFKNDQALVDAWMASPGHRENILNEHYTEIGVAVAEGLFEGKKVWLAVQHFGLPKSFCPAVDEVLHGTINLEERQAKIMEEDLALRRQKINDRVVYEDLTTNEQIDKYNSLVGIYNQLVIELKEKINNYNKQVQNFNSCLAENTTESTE